MVRVNGNFENKGNYFFTKDIVNKEIKEEKVEKAVVENKADFTERGDELLAAAMYGKQVNFVSVADKLDILNFYVFNKCNNLSSRELNMILKIERELRGHDFKFEYPGYTEGDSNQSNQINTYIINILNEALNKLAEQRGEYLRAERPIPKELSDKINEYSTNLCHRELYMAQKNDPENDYVILEVNNSEVKEVYNSRQN